MGDETRDSSPQITAECAGATGADHRVFVELPEDYRRFLSASNGGLGEEYPYAFLSGSAK